MYAESLLVIEVPVPDGIAFENCDDGGDDDDKDAFNYYLVLV